MCWPCWVIRGCFKLAESSMLLPFRRVPAGLKGGAKGVAGIAELAAWLLLTFFAAIFFGTLEHANDVAPNGFKCSFEKPTSRRK